MYFNYNHGITDYYTIYYNVAIIVINDNIIIPYHSFCICYYTKFLVCYHLFIE